jgi:hypothetical protein
MIIWLFLTVMILFIAPTILRIFRVRNYEWYAAKYIFIKVGNIVSCVSTWIVRVITDYPNNNPFWDIKDPFWFSDSIWENSNGWVIYEL